MSYREWDDMDDQARGRGRWLRVVLLAALGLVLAALVFGCATTCPPTPAPLPGTTVVERCPPCPTPAPIPPLVLELPPPGLCEAEAEALERALAQCMAGIAERDAALAARPVDEGVAPTPPP